MAIQEGLSAEEVDEVHPKVDLGEAGWTRICGDKEKSIRQVLLRYGGHNRILTHSAASLAILRAFGEVE
ncbi:MAG: hypothetical protein M1819_007290 [Sarea resinae]|nr:MAG: hypothetical protein M1819_007290 [Sarea resinae]